MDKKIPLLIGGFLIGLVIGWLILSARKNEPLINPGMALLNEDVSPQNSDELQVKPRVGGLAPDFELQTYDGEAIRLDAFKGQPVLINFWATWCGPCRIEMPAIQSKFTEFEPELAVLAVNFDESASEIEKFSEELGLSFELLVDPGGVVNQQVYQVRAYPSSFFIDSEGIIQVVHLGLMTENQLDDYLGRVGVGVSSRPS
jgi:peroxiredoxin